MYKQQGWVHEDVYEGRYDCNRRYGLPLCFTILTLGMWDRTSSINSPLLSVEVSQSGYGMYVKYLMVGFLAIFAFSMVIQFSSYLLKHFGVLRGETATTTANP